VTFPFFVRFKSGVYQTVFRIRLVVFKLSVGALWICVANGNIDIQCFKVVSHHVVLRAEIYSSRNSNLS